jgi:hypothetical protein
MLAGGGIGAGAPGEVNGACNGAPCGSVNADCADAPDGPRMGSVSTARRMPPHRVADNVIDPVFGRNRGDFKPVAQTSQFVSTQRPC